MKCEVTPATGKLGILIPGLGAVATTFTAGVVAVKKGIAQPIGSLTQMGNIHLGKRPEDCDPKIREFVPLADLNDIAFGRWDIFEDNVYEAALNAKVLDLPLLQSIKAELEAIKPMTAVFDQSYVSNLSGTNVKTAATKYNLALQVIADIENFKMENDCNRLVIVWCGGTEKCIEETDIHSSIPFATSWGKIL